MTKTQLPDPVRGSDLIPRFIEESHRIGETFRPLKLLAMDIVHRAMVECYGDNYSIRCMECTMGFKSIFTKWGIDGFIVMGALCIPNIEPRMDLLTATWAGFWGKDHHFWAMTRFHEFVDLGMSQNHLHPVSLLRSPLQPPAVWFSVTKPFPHFIRLMPFALMGEARSSDEQPRMEVYLRRVDELLDQAMIKTYQPGDIVFTGAPFATSIDDLNRLANAGDPWCSRAHLFQDIPQPEWVAARIKELETGSLASRLVQPDFQPLER